MVYFILSVNPFLKVISGEIGTNILKRDQAVARELPEGN